MRRSRRRETRGAQAAGTDPRCNVLRLCHEAKRYAFGAPRTIRRRDPENPVWLTAPKRQAAIVAAPPTERAMIEFKDVSKAFWTGAQHKVILDRATLTVPLGQSIGILAANGTGKTTLINMMAGLERPDSGTINRQCRVSFPLGFVGGVNNRHSGTENARNIARLYGLDPDYVEAFSRWMCDLAEYFDRPVGTYSQGMRARFSFSLMLAMDFDIYLIDEGMPNTTDVAFNARAGAILRERLKDTTVIIVSHLPDTLERFARSAAVLRDGQLHMFDTLDEARALYDYQGQG
jgi:capsular polysaccharide transport system ATP-binding protein